MTRWPAWLFVAAYAYGGILVIIHAPEFALGGGLMMFVGGLIGGMLIVVSARDRDAAPRKAEGFEAEGQQPGPPEEAASPNP